MLDEREIREVGEKIVEKIEEKIGEKIGEKTLFLEHRNENIILNYNLLYLSA